MPIFTEALLPVLVIMKGLTRIRGRGCSVRISAGTPVILNGVLPGLPKFFHTNIRKIPRLRHGHFLPNLSEFIEDLLSNRSTRSDLSTDNVAEKTHNTQHLYSA